MSRSDQYLKSLIKSRLQVAGLDRLEASGFPDIEDYSHFIRGEMNEQSEQKMLFYLSTHPEAARLIALVRESYESEKAIQSQKVPLGFELKAKNLIYPKKNLDHINIVNLIYLLAAIAAFALSFILKRYFVQCVAVAVVLAFKWIMEEKSRKTQILIYKSIQETQTESNSRDLHRIKPDL